MSVKLDEKTMKYSCREVIPGKASGEAIVSPEAMCMYLCDPKTGIVIEKGHPLEGRSISGKILVLKSGKGSSVVQLDGFYQLSVNLICLWPSLSIKLSRSLFPLPWSSELRWLIEWSVIRTKS